MANVVRVLFPGAGNGTEGDVLNIYGYHTSRLGTAQMSQPLAQSLANWVRLEMTFRALDIRVLAGSKQMQRTNRNTFR